MKKSSYLGILASICLSTAAQGQVPDTRDGNIANIFVNNTEANVKPYTMPDVLKLSNGQPVTDAKTWMEKRRPEILNFYTTQVYGRIPATAPKVTFEVVSTDENALEGKAVMKQLAGRMGGPDAPAFNVTLYTPKGATGPVPILIGFGGFGAGRGRGPASGPATGPGAQARGPATGPGARVGRGPATNRGGFVQRNVPLEMINNGFAYAALAQTTVETDQEGGVNINIVRKLALAPGQEKPAADEWGSIACWAWGMSRLVDYLETQPAIDAKRIAITGASRLGKTVLWEGASDPRIALVIASASGEGGAALARRNYGETVAHLVAPTRYPYQFAANYQKYAEDPGKMDFDTHMLVALVAPRPILLQTGTTDGWSDPKGEYLAAIAATPVYKLFGKKGVEESDTFAADTFMGHDLAYWLHTGGHGPIPSDWDVFIKFMNTHFKK